MSKCDSTQQLVTTREPRPLYRRETPSVTVDSVPSPRAPGTADEGLDLPFFRRVWTPHYDLTQNYSVSEKRETVTCIRNVNFKIFEENRKGWGAFTLYSQEVN